VERAAVPRRLWIPFQQKLAEATLASRSSWAKSTRATARIRFTPLRSLDPPASPFARSVVAHPPRPILTWLFAPLKPSPPTPRSSTLESDSRPSRAQRPPRLPQSPEAPRPPEVVTSRPEDCHAPAPGEPESRSLKQAPAHGTRPRRQRPVFATPPESESVLTGLDRLATITLLPRPLPVRSTTPHPER
jgi:hypothetical protein